MTVASIFTPNLNKTQPVEPSVEPALTVTSHARNTFEIKNLSSHQEMRQNLKRPTQTSILRTPEETRAIKLRKVAKSLGVVSARMGRTRSKTKQHAGITKIQSIAKLRHRRSLMKPISFTGVEEQNLSQVFGTQKNYVFEFYNTQDLFREIDDTYTVIEQLRRLFLQHRLKQAEGIHFKVIFFGSDYDPETNDHDVFSTKYYQRPVELLEVINTKIDSFSATYDATEFDVSKIIISLLATNLGNVASASAKRAEMHNKYLMPSEYNTKKNCAYTAIAICKNPIKFVQDYVDQLEAQANDNEKKIVFTDWAQRGSQIKFDLNNTEEIKKGFASSEDLETYVSRQVKDKRDLIVRDCQFKIVQHIKAPKSKDSNPWRKQKNGPQAIELQRVNNHVRPLIKRAVIPDDLLAAHDSAQMSLQTKPIEELTARRIVKDFIRNAKQENDQKIMTADIETSNQESTDEQLRRGVKTSTYAAGCAWYRKSFDSEKEPEGCEIHADGDKEILYKAWWGHNALTDYITFLDENQQYFNKTTIYFHNGRKFDLHQVIRDCLFDYWGFEILTEKCIMSNGRWINFGIEGKDRMHHDFQRFICNDSIWTS